MGIAEQGIWIESDEESNVLPPRGGNGSGRVQLVRVAPASRVTGVRQRRTTGPGGLTRREVEVLQLVSSGMTNRAAARTLWVTSETVKFHLTNVYRKLGVSNRVEASRWAHENGVADSV
jgi:DNA-binding CsgD family transcriptional regulator